MKCRFYPAIALAGAIGVSAGGAATIREIEAEQQLPDFSYAGYHRSEKAIPRRDGPVFDITDFGAVADDGKSDRAAIQAAIDAAERVGGGVVLVPAGRFELNGIGDVATIEITSGDTVMRGEGSGPDGSVLHMSEAMPPPPPMKLWASPYAIVAGPPEKSRRVLGRVLENAARGDRTVRVENGSTLQPGDWIALRLVDNDPELVAAELAGFEVIDKRWRSIREEGVSVTERHQVAAVNGDRVTLTAPVIKPVDTRYRWMVEALEPAEEIGFENLRFVGEWRQEFVHHRSWMDDGGYSLLRLSNVANSWVRDCVFENVNRACTVSGSAQVTLLECRVEGFTGHNAIHVAGSTSCLIARCQDLAPQWHSLGVSAESIGSVLWRCYWHSSSCFESHASQPRHTLIDTCTGGFFKGRAGGAAQNLPNHLEGLVLWNYRKTSPPENGFPFEPLGETYWRILQPLIVGMYGTPITFREGQATVISLGRPVPEGSLYEFQVRRRLGKLPADLVTR